MQASMRSRAREVSARVREEEPTRAICIVGLGIALVTVAYWLEARGLANVLRLHSARWLVIGAPGIALVVSVVGLVLRLRNREGRGLAPAIAGICISLLLLIWDLYIYGWLGPVGR